MVPQSLVPEAAWLLPVHPPPATPHRRTLALSTRGPEQYPSPAPSVGASPSRQLVPAPRPSLLFFPELSQDSNLGLDSTAGLPDTRCGSWVGRRRDQKSTGTRASGAGPRLDQACFPASPEH